jgi:formylglycine-generating enzyme required for sulfatase activity
MGEFESLLEGLLSAYRRHQDLRQMVRLRLGENLEAIAGTGGQNLNDIVFNLIEWAQANGRARELATKAYQDKPENERLKKLAADFPEMVSWTGNDTSSSDAPPPNELVYPADDMVLIPGGTFLMGSSGVETELDGFYIDRCPVTNKQYKMFVDATKREPPSHWMASSVPAELVDHPAVNVTWYDAEAYATWCGKRLPSSAQWERAARGTNGRKFPWGDVFDESRCNTLESKQGATTPAGMYPNGASPDGVLDMAGNVWEWTRSDDVESHILIRGGSWKVVALYARCFHTLTQRRGFSNTDLGFRCVREL